MIDRQDIVTSARSWVGTPYHHMARVKGAGVDCGQLLIKAFSDAGYAKDFDPGFYTCDWHLHRDENVYLGFVEQYFDRAPDDTELPLSQRELTYVPLPGDIIMFKVGRCYSHGAIVSEWPNIIHAYLPSAMVEEVSIINTPMSARPMRIYTPRNAR